VAQALVPAASTVFTGHILDRPYRAHCGHISGMLQRMPWKEHGVMEERYRFVLDWRSGDWEMAQLCRLYAVSRTTGYKWAERYERLGMDGLRDRSRAPLHHPNQVAPELEDLVIALRERHPTWGAPKLRALFRRDFPDQPLPAESTVGELLRRNGLTVARKRKRTSRRPTEPLAHAGAPNAVWCADYKGWFRTADLTRIDPFTLTDAYSRYLLRCQALDAADHAHTKPVIEAALREFGLPQRIRTDNGPPFGTNGESGLTALAVWFIKLGIVPEHIEPGKPQQNGRHERMHRTLKQETAAPPAGTRRAQQRRFDHFREEYNEQRPHQALNQNPPASYYHNSPRTYPERLREPDYPADWDVRRVSAGGQFRWHSDKVFVGHALIDEPIGLEAVDEHRWRVWFHFYEVGTLDRGELSVRRPKPNVAPSPAPTEPSAHGAASSRPPGSLR